VVQHFEFWPTEFLELKLALFRGICAFSNGWKVNSACSSLVNETKQVHNASDLLAELDVQMWNYNLFKQVTMLYVILLNSLVLHELIKY